MDVLDQLRQQVEHLAALSITHLSPQTREKLNTDALSVNAHPIKGGALIYVGHARYRDPTETDLAEIFKLAEKAGIAWLFFDEESTVIDGLPVLSSI